MGTWTASVGSETGGEMGGEIGGTPGGPASPARLRVAVSRLARWLRPTAAAGHLSTAEVDILMVAEKRGAARMSDLASFCGLNPTMLSRMVPRLEEAGLLRREVEPADKRVSRVEATPLASELLDKVRSEREDALSKLLDELDEDERSAIAAATPVLEKLAERVREQSGRGGQRR